MGYVDEVETKIRDDTSIFRLGGWKAKQSRDDDRGILILTANYIVVDKEMPEKKTKRCIEHQR